MVAKTGRELFSFLAKQIETFLKVHHEDHFEQHIRRRQTVSTPEGYRDEHVFRLGFTFSFPVQQVGINKGKLIRWTKGFNIQDVVGQDVCALLQQELDRLRLPVRVAALVNDTVGTLMSRAYTSPGKSKTLLGAIFGTGTNGAYVEKLHKITKPMEGEYDQSTGEMVVNTEWGSFDNEMSVIPTTDYDRQLDRDSVNPGIQMFEKHVSGMFLGEILRIVLLSLMKSPSISLFRDINSSENDIRSTTTVGDDSPLYTQWAVDSSILSIAEADNSVGLRVLRQEMDKQLGVSAASHEDAEAVKIIARAIGTRAARLAGVAIAAVVLQTERLTAPTDGRVPSATIADDVKKGNLADAAKNAAQTVLASAATTFSTSTTASGAAVPDATPTASKPPSHEEIPEEDIIDIGVDGSLVEYYPGFEDGMRSALRAVSEIGVHGEKRIRIGIAKDGSGVGAALIALVAAQQERRDSYISGADLRTRLGSLREGFDGPADYEGAHSGSGLEAVTSRED
jgi:hexokinase